MQPTPDLTKVWDMIEADRRNRVTQQIGEIIEGVILLGTPTLLLFIFILWLIYRNRKAIKRFFD